MVLGNPPSHHVQAKPSKPTQARTIVEAALLKAPGNGCGRPHSPTTAEVNHGEFLPPEISGGHEDDRHDVEAASHRTFQVHALKREDVSGAICEAKLEGVHGHERGRHPTCGGRV